MSTTIELASPAGLLAAVAEPFNQAQTLGRNICAVCCIIIAGTGIAATTLTTALLALRPQSRHRTNVFFVDPCITVEGLVLARRLGRAVGAARGTFLHIVGGGAGRVLVVANVGSGVVAPVVAAVGGLAARKALTRGDVSVKLGLNEVSSRGAVVESVAKSLAID